MTTNTRSIISLNMSTRDILGIMAEGNIGALNVLLELTKDPLGIMYIIDLDDMGMRGSQIWVAFKDHCKENIETLKISLQDRDQALVDTVNASHRHVPNTPEAVTHGASSPYEN